MRGQMFTYQPCNVDEIAPTVRELTAPPELEEVQKGVEGYIEAIHGFTSIGSEGARRPCVAFCNEDGKNNKLATNNWATMLWHQALLAQGHRGLLDVSGRAVDWLVGPVVVLTGDDQFMHALRHDDDGVG